MPGLLCFIQLVAEFLRSIYCCANSIHCVSKTSITTITNRVLICIHHVRIVGRRILPCLEVCINCITNVGNVFVRRGVNTTDAMTATIEEIPYEILHKITYRITHEVEGINRVLLDLTPKPTGTIEWE